MSHFNTTKIAIKTDILFTLILLYYTKKNIIKIRNSTKFFVFFENRQVKKFLQIVNCANHLQIEQADFLYLQMDRNIYINTPVINIFQ